MKQPENLHVKEILRMTFASLLVGLFFAGIARTGIDATKQTPQTTSVEIVG